MLLSNYTTTAITVASVATRCVNGGPGFPVVEATISTVHQVKVAPSVLLLNCLIMAAVPLHLLAMLHTRGLPWDRVKQQRPYTSDYDDEGWV